MRWERLFDDLEATWQAGDHEQVRAEVADRTRRERATVSMLGRLAAQNGPIELLLLGGRRLEGVPVDVGMDFLVVADAGFRRIVPLTAIVQVSGLLQLVAGPGATAAVRRFGLGSALRGVSRDRSPVRVDDTVGRVLTGTIDGVGADYLEVVEHPIDVARRKAEVLGRRVLPFTAIVSVSST